ncbi:MAG: TetR/AcrR family transcriptional regulator [Clostridia bacterium]|nr:TetR/AcrR family transcriptional regulator [Clostridia bacterium]
MPRTKEQNEKIRESKKERILDAALSLYVRFGYNGTDMDEVAANAGVAKGLVYYYYKTKNDLFRELFDTAVEKAADFSRMFYKASESMSPVEKLVKYSADIFGMTLGDPRLIRFAMRMPFDAYAVFGPGEWEKGLAISVEHRDNLEKIIASGMAEGSMKCTDAASAANSFWTVYAANLFNFTGMMAGRGYEDRLNDRMSLIEGMLAFGMAGLGVDEKAWKKEMAGLITERRI